MPNPVKGVRGQRSALGRSHLFVMDHSTLLTQLNTFVGVGTAWIGLYVVAPAGTDLLRSTVLGWLRRGAARMRFWSRRSRGATVDLRPASVSMTAQALSPTVVTQGWLAAGSVEDRINALRKQISDVEQSLGNLSKEVRGGLADLRREITQLERAIRRESADLRGYVEANTREAVRIDARGLPVLAMGILLTAAPAQLAAIPLLGWALLVATATLAAAVGTSTWRQHRRIRGGETRPSS